MNDNRYKIIVHQHPTKLTTEIIAVSSYAGRPVRGKAICHPDDDYNEEVGIELAKARCDAKIAEKRLQRAGRKIDEAKALCIEANKHYAEMQGYLLDATCDYQASRDHLRELLETL